MFIFLKPKKQSDGQINKLRRDGVTTPPELPHKVHKVV